MKRTEYSIEQGQLVIRDALTGQVMRCDFEVAVSKMLPLRKDNACLVLLDPAATKKPNFENLLKVRQDGAVEWKAELPDSHDAFVSMHDCGDHVEANTWNGYHVEIDLNSGRTRNVRFVK
jgi:hypothetical protein